MERSEEVSSSQVQFSQLVKEADTSEEDTDRYKFSNGRKFKAGLGAYEPEE